MQEYRSQTFKNPSILTPKESYNSYNVSYIQYSPAIQSKRNTKESAPTERPKSNKARPTGNPYVFSSLTNL